MLLRCYQALVYGLIPLALLRLWWRGRRLPAYRQRWAERLALGYTPPCQGVIWLHTVSLGEFRAAEPLIDALLAQYPQQTLLITCMTPTGSAAIQKRPHPRIKHVYLPYDIGWCVRRFIRLWQPNILLLFETELWPNWIVGCGQHGIDVHVINARLSSRACRRYARLRSAWQPLLRGLWIAAQTDHTKRRFMYLGVDAQRIQVCGNLKYDLRLPSDLDQQTDRWRQNQPERPTWIAASTHPGEEESILKAHRVIQQHQPNTLLWLVPRHPERATELMQLAQQHGFAPQTRSNWSPKMATDVVIGDTIGELVLFYALADVAWIGGSFIEHGGQNYLEPAALAKPILTGPSTFNFADVYRRLQRHDAIITVTADSLADTVIQLLQQPATRTQLGIRAHQVALSQQGATIKHMHWLQPHLKLATSFQSV